MKNRSHRRFIRMLVLPVLVTACAAPPSPAPPQPPRSLSLDDIDLPADPDEWTEWRNSLAPDGEPGPELTLAENGRSTWRIVLPAEPRSQDRVAAKEFARWFEHMTGARLETVTEDVLPDDAANLVCLGWTERLAAANLEIADRDLKEEGYGIAAADGRLFLWGGARRGPINAVFALLEEDLGCRWYGEGHDAIPVRRTLRCRPVSRTYTPQVRLRDPFYHPSFDAEWSLRNRTNAPGAEVSEEAGGRIDYAGGLFVHTVHALLPPTEYYDEHPEFYQMTEDGRRVAHQLCMTNDTVVQLVTEKVREILRGSPNGDIMSVSKMDGGGTCRCPKCKALDEAEGSDMASLLYLVNGVAEAIEDEFPDTVVSTLAYLETIGVPKTLRPRDNVAVRVCTDSCMWSHPFTRARESDRFAPVLKQWSEVCDRMYIWDYNVNFSYYVAPMPNMDVIADNIRFFVENNAEGIMTQGAYQSPGAERDVMRSWVIAKLMWNPSLDVRELMRDFVWGHYGNAAPAMAAWDRLLRQAAREHADSLAAPVGGIRYGMDHPFLSDELLEKGVQVFDIAERTAHSEPVFKRVARARLPLMFVRLSRGPEYVGAGYGELVDRFEAVAQRVGLTHIAEGPPDVERRVEGFRKRWRDYAVHFEPEPGIFVGETRIAMSTPFENGRIHYTLDGTRPTTDSPAYRKPLNLEATTTIKALVVGAAERGDEAPLVEATWEKVEPLEAVEPPAGQAAEGVRYDYYEGLWGLVPDFDELEPVAGGVANGIGLEPAAREDLFALRFKGFVRVENEGIYRFFTTSDDGSKLWIGDRLVVDHDGMHAASEASGHIALAAGWHPITVGYFQGPGGSALEAAIEGPGLEKQKIKGSMLRP